MTDTPADSFTSSIRLVDSYFDAWNHSDAAAREALLAAVFSADGRYVDPVSDVTGPEAIAAMMAGVHDQYPGITVRRTSTVDAHHDVLRFEWEVLGADRSVAIAGIDVCHVGSDGKLRDVRGFFGTTVPA